MSQLNFTITSHLFRPNFFLFFLLVSSIVSRCTPMLRFCAFSYSKFLVHSLTNESKNVRNPSTVVILLLSLELWRIYFISNHVFPVFLFFYFLRSFSNWFRLHKIASAKCLNRNRRNYTLEKKKKHIFCRWMFLRQWTLLVANFRFGRIRQLNRLKIYGFGVKISYAPRD